MSSLKSKLKKQSTATGSGVARAFLRAQAALFGTYRDALRYKPVRNESSIAVLGIHLCRVLSNQGDRYTVQIKTALYRCKLYQMVIFIWKDSRCP